MDNQTIEGEYLTPIPRKQGEAITMSFPDAVAEIILGKKVRRLSWPETDHALLKDGWLSIFTKGAFHTFLVSDGDLEGQDFIVIKEQN